MPPSFKLGLLDLELFGFYEKMLGCAAVTILVPEQLCSEADHLLSGSFTSSQATYDGRISHAVVITGVGRDPEPHLGCINNNRHQTRRKPASSVWVELKSHPHIALLSVTIQDRNIPLSDVNLVIYSATEICQSELIDRKFPCCYAGESDHHANDIVPYLIHCVQRDCSQQIHNEKKNMCDRFILYVIRMILVISWLPKVSLQYINSLLMSRLEYSSTALRQILLRISQVEKIQEEMKENRKILISGSLLAMIIIDVLAGVSIACAISSYASIDDIYSSFRSCTKVVAEGVHVLLEWLSGAPAGLKLNQPLTQALASFFSYHVHLWRLYLELAEPVLRWLAWVVVWVGACGASAQVAVLADLLDLATLHLYCFYVYAARIHMLQICVLESQWRAFRGRKWNPLKQRVDGQEGGGSVDSLSRVLTTVLLTLSLFLLPTTTVYYLVFIMLRIVLNVSRGLLNLAVWLLNINPVFILLLSAIGSTRIKGDIYFASVGEGACGSPKHTPLTPLLLRLHTWSTPLNEILSSTHIQDFFPVRPVPHWSYILSSVMFVSEPWKEDSVEAVRDCNKDAGLVDVCGDAWLVDVCGDAWLVDVCGGAWLVDVCGDAMYETETENETKLKLSCLGATLKQGENE
ncbi:hypothetical protein Pcinc_028635 [Petrolisthes cinctipes]|uniref:Phosphatidylinositol N-acetylglucosaminyltransferase subunit Q n=1 Tax=Petrolisthes cinctipes TaxID=88211 RepID=A0AAE1F2S2_PETCI|nr:hypothetical protein Pcinc_028635 [Petrolisthes cinctipes]